MSEQKTILNNGMQMTKLTSNQSPIGKQFSNANAQKKLLPLHVYAIKGLQNKQELYLGNIRLKDFIENANYQTDIWGDKRSAGSRGYQREPSSRKATEFGTFMTNHVDNFTPSTLYLNIRDTDLNYVKVTSVNDAANLYKIIIGERATIWVVDGQHRLKGLREVLDYANDPDIELPIVLTLGLNKNEEMLQFVTINKARASVKTDLAERDLADAVRRDKQFEADLMQRDNIIAKELPFIRKAVDVMDELHTTPGSPWYNRVTMPNQKKNSNTTISSATFVDSLEPLMKQYLGKSKKKPDPPLVPYDEEKIVKHLNAVWKGIRQVNPDMFKKENVCKYVIQHTIGTMVIHGVLNLMWHNAKSDKLIHASQEDFKKIFNIPSIKDKKAWDKEVPSHGGRFTTYGTNKKSFSIIQKIIYDEVKNNRHWIKNFRD